MQETQLQSNQTRYEQQAEELAATYRLGSLQQTYGVHFTVWVILCSVISLLFAGCAGFFSAWMLIAPRNINDVNGAPILMVFGAIVLVLGLGCLLYPTIYRSWRVYVYSEGFVYFQGKKIDVFRWEQLESLWQEVNKIYINGIYAGTRYKYTIGSMDGRLIFLTDRITHVGRLGELIHDMVTKIKLPQAIDALKAGHTLFFGPLSINLQVINNSKDFLTWPEVNEIQVNNGTVSIKKEGKWLSWSSLQVAHIPNFFIFFSLVNAIKQGSLF